MTLFALFFLFSASHGVVYLEYTPNSDFEQHWIYSTAKSDFGKLVFFNGTETYNMTDSGVQTSEDSKFYTASLKFDQPLQFDEKGLVLQYAVHNKQSLDCGGTYLKVFPEGSDLRNINSDSPYIFMFGPDKCGGNKKIHVIFRYKGKNLERRSVLEHYDQTGSHIYTMVVTKDLKYSVYVDGTENVSGDLWEDLDFGMDGKTIEDKDAVKPEDWVDEEMIEDKESTKPDNWVEEEFIPDTDANKPEDWDDENDGEWERPTMRNPEYIGPWKPRNIQNPDYKGPWVRPFKKNDDFIADEESLKQRLGSLALEVWQVQSGSVFSNFLVTDDAEYALSIARELRPRYNEFNTANDLAGQKDPTEGDDESEEEEEYDKPDVSDNEVDGEVTEEPNPEL